MAASPDPWVVLSIAPVPPERASGWFAGLDGIDLRFPEERTPEAVCAAITTADIVVPDWSSALHLDRAAVAAAVGRIFGLVRANVARVVAGESVESVVNGLGPIVQ